MIRRLSVRCWYVNGDGETGAPHFPTQAQARADAAEVVDEGRPPPVLRRVDAPCWVAACDRCGRPLGDLDECWSELHCVSRAQLRGALDAAGWQATEAGGRQRWCCPGCAAARPALGEVTWVPVTVRQHGADREVLGEATGCPQLAVTVLRGPAPAEDWWGVTLTHRPTGRGLPTAAWTDDVGDLHRLAELLAHLDWTSTDQAHYATGYTEPLIDALDRVAREHVASLGGAR